MDSLDRQFCDFLNEEPQLESRQGLYDALGVDPQDPSLFYLIPLPNLCRAVETGGLHCRNAVPAEMVDLSGRSVQSRRTREIQLKGYVSRPVHDCLNFFFNPLNNTLLAFRHNALVREQMMGSSDAGIVVIMRVSLPGFLEYRNWNWTVSEANVAAGGNPLTGFSRKRYQQMAWSDIFQLPSDELDRLNSIRSAEFLAFGGTGQASVALPTDIASEIICAPWDREAVVAALPSLATRVREVQNENVFPARDRLLHHERELLKGMWRFGDAYPIEEFARDIVGFSARATAEFGPMNEARFQSGEVANGLHGVGHVTRVMFWADLLARSGPDTALLKPVLTAAALHDLCRFNNSVEPTHGMLSVQHHAAMLDQWFPDETMRQVVADAVAFHSRDDAEYPHREENEVWQLLKDADALDRGRFSAPDTAGGCDTGVFRSKILRDDPEFARNLAWMAYRLARITKFTPWHEGGSSYEPFTAWVIAGLRACQQYCEFEDERDAERARRFIDALP